MLRYIPIVAVLALVLGGCTAAQIATSPVVGKIASVVAKPILGLAVKDARTTMAWVEREAAAGRLSEANVALATQCPSAVLALDALREQLAGENVEELEGFKGLIYFGTLERFGQSPQEDVALGIEELAGSCIRLIPAEKLINIFG